MLVSIAGLIAAGELLDVYLVSDHGYTCIRRYSKVFVTKFFILGVAGHFVALGCLHSYPRTLHFGSRTTEP